MFKPEPKEQYWWIDGCGTIRLAIYYTDYKTTEHENRINLGNCFKRERHAKAALAKLRALFKQIQEETV